MPNYLFFRVPFAFLDFEKAGWLVFLENLLMLSFWAFVGTLAALICRNAGTKVSRKLGGRDEDSCAYGKPEP
jgi:hypothetical protein